MIYPYIDTLNRSLIHIILKEKQHFNLDNVWERNVEADRGEANTGHQPVQQTTGMADH